MKIRYYLIILPLSFWAFAAHAQLPQQPQEPQQPAGAPEQWELTLDVIKSKAQTLLLENNGLEDEYRKSMEQIQQLRQAIADQQYKNGQTERFLKNRHGRTDQQLRLEELTQTVDGKKQNARTLEGQSRDLSSKQSDLDAKIQKLKYTISNLELRQQAQKQKAQGLQPASAPGADDQLNTWRKRLEDENKQEVLLENELASLKSGDKTQNLNADALELENKQLDARLNFLRLQKLRHIQSAGHAVITRSNAQRYDELKSRKEQLEAMISAYEMRLDQLRDSSLMTLSWPAKKKKLVHEMVQSDAHNNQMRDKIKVLREDIMILRDQVARLERRLDFAKGENLR